MRDFEILSAMATTRLTYDGLTLQAISVNGIEELAGAASGVIHSDDYMPFGFPWSAGTPEQRVHHLRSWYAARLREANRERWTLIFSVRLDGKIVGSTNLYADHFSDQRTVSTGSWLLRGVHGRGIGTSMRLMLLDLAFGHLGADHATSEAWEDNWPSRRVNEKCGYLLCGQYEKARGDGTATMLQYCLPRGRWATESSTARQAIVEIDPRLAAALL
ncbi:GNAT family protein [Cryobacterium sp. GrIS_2_6]|uniref:GNAT family N-acetyltransferase n=1 Tax=Cryobacterium sp. GrIS_2_6 TaxID=3162785 RepID=UPI002E0102D3|nr:RimJ/RimL family protein N-acetyltransferase [Cryobacterium psychrotolerans]